MTAQTRSRRSGARDARHTAPRGDWNLKPQIRDIGPPVRSTRRADPVRWDTAEQERRRGTRPTTRARPEDRRDTQEQSRPTARTSNAQENSAIDSSRRRGRAASDSSSGHKHIPILDGRSGSVRCNCRRRPSPLSRHGNNLSRRRPHRRLSLQVPGWEESVRGRASLPRACDPNVPTQPDPTCHSVAKRRQRAQ